LPYFGPTLDCSKDLSRDDGRRHCEVMVLVPWRPDDPPHVEEVCVEALDAQRLARRAHHPLCVVPVDGPGARLGSSREGLAIHHPVGDVLRTIVREPFGNRGRKRLAMAKGDAEDTRHRY